MYILSLYLQVPSSECVEIEKSSLSRGLTKVLEQLMNLIVRDCVTVWIHDITSDHARINQPLMLVTCNMYSSFPLHVI